jgi:hypothetical protein
MSHANLYIDSATEAVFSPAIRNYTTLLLTRFLPIFDDVEREQQRASEEALANSSNWHEDEASVAEHAYDEGIAQAMMFMEMRTVFIATGVAGLFHLFEKQLYRFLNQGISRYQFMIRRKNTDVPLVISKWDEAEEIIKAFPVTRRDI